MPLWKLICQWQVLSASVVTLTMGMLLGSLDSIQPMRAKDKFHASASKNGLLFVTNGVISLVLSTPVGCAVDWLIGRYGERTRMWIVLTGLILTGSAVIAMGFSSSFDMILGIQAWLSISLLLVNIPVMSSFGDFVNALGLNSMAQSYCLYNAAWAMALMGAPPLATFLYTQLGYKAMLSGVLVGLIILCTVLVLGGSIWQKYRLLAHRSTS
ncbi:hypothetical protein BX661DRAFT_179811 [Kickxella alabastrina]|uniref:uncharacterized protein n=1 Tax=Kickxella alabastrina TaxID=61397 RepID=UPI002220ED6B|nr:uncharacterized protein BX661DRAFT_179811 [Kickxella alabastrina]KAI7832101.1 hypothetical protein BX661DRAFT_179811 [Kickxella alabastrina]